MLTIKQGLKLSAIVDKLELKINNPKGSPEEVGADLMLQVITKAHKAEQEIYAFIAEIKGITPKEAENIDLFTFIREIVSDTSVMGFFNSAVKSGVQE